MATIPAAVQMLAGAVFARGVARLMNNHGRRAGFQLCSVAMFIGGGCAVFSLHAESFIGLSLSHAFLGLGVLGINYFRYASAETAPTHLKASASSITIASGVIAVPIGGMLYRFGIEYLSSVPFAGPYLIVSGTGLIGCVVVFFLQMSSIPKSRQAVRKTNRSVARYPQCPDLRFSVQRSDNR